ncbi:hypothetical protein BAUCODRAFT_263876 [Baudoinia panamericana UAMH 10762]|uniref:Uncharacterized protein n=1 Tax=Baudoinia panamericana (strain UAMH 10762) TaxID=717646 RepID=M2LFM6_BAUPA|nr:uncharacterized protein BAUCODRAFT_263876 [Baudoinia panamericana UAMH 10762]EMC92847.1 hypothetical protein BAUCODRAFT_263876 [Baudoinia panamericana UAMH 10762]
MDKVVLNLKHATHLARLARNAGQRPEEPLEARRGESFDQSRPGYFVVHPSRRKDKHAATSPQSSETCQECTFCPSCDPLGPNQWLSSAQRQCTTHALYMRPALQGTGHACPRPPSEPQSQPQYSSSQYSPPPANYAYGPPPHLYWQQPLTVMYTHEPTQFQPQFQPLRQHYDDQQQQGQPSASFNDPRQWQQQTYPSRCQNVNCSGPLDS